MWKCPFPYLASKTKRHNSSNSTEPNILLLNYDSYQEILSYIPALEDQLNFARAHEQFLDVVSQRLRLHCNKINMKMLKTINDWRYLMQICGAHILECTICHGPWDEKFTMSFVQLLQVHCTNLKHICLIFVDSFEIDLLPPKNPQILLELRQLHNLRSLTLTDAKAIQLQQLHHFTELDSLTMDGIDRAMDESVFCAIFQSMSKLKTLTLRFGSAFVLSRQLPRLAKFCPLLEQLTLDNYDSLLSELGDFVNLKSLHLISRWNLTANTYFFAALANQFATRLEFLELRRVQIECQQVEQIAKLQELRAFKSDWWPLSDAAQLTQLTQLECLTLGEYEQNKGSLLILPVVKACTRLKHLKLGNPWHVDKALLDALYKVINERGNGGLTLQFGLPDVQLQEELSTLYNVKLLRLDWQSRLKCHWCVQNGASELMKETGVFFTSN